LVQNKVEYKCAVRKSGNKFHVRINEKKQLTIEDSFELNDEVLNVAFDQDETLILQLVSKHANGNIILQYLGTKVMLSLFI
jgi:hypothetical protein